MQRDGHSDDRTKAGASGRTPPVIEGAAVEVGVTPAATVEPVAEVDEPIVESAPDEAVETAEASAPPPPRKRSRAPRVIFTLLGLIIVAFAGAVAWLATPGSRAGDLKSKVIALLPPSAQQMLHLTSAPDAKTESAAKAPAATPSPAAP